MTKEQFGEALGLIQGFDTIIIHRHSNPDGDAIGSQVGLKTLIEDNFPEKKVYQAGDPAGRYGFIEGSKMDEIPDELYKEALAIVLDCSAPHLISDERYRSAKATLRFDHHIFVERICSLELTETSYESCCGLIADFARTLDLRLSPKAAKALYTGMITDSGRFLYDSTTSRTHALASYLLSAGFRTDDIFRSLYSEDFANTQNRARFILKIQFTEHKVAYIYTTKEEVQASNMTLFGISRGMVNTMANIKGVNIWVNFTETEDAVMAELRSDSYNINPIAVKYGGGGHQKASGATLKDREEAMAMLRDLDRMMEEGNR